jgi:hypothetical protein
MLIDFNGTRVFAPNILAIEKGEYSSDKQDWLAVIVGTGGARIYLSIHCAEAAQMIEDYWAGRFKEGDSLKGRVHGGGIFEAGVQAAGGGWENIQGGTVDIGGSPVPASKEGG